MTAYHSVPKTYWNLGGVVVRLIAVPDWTLGNSLESQRLAFLSIPIDLNKPCKYLWSTN
jgi:hypothetical protein